MSGKKIFRAVRGILGFGLAVALVGWVVAGSGVDLREVWRTVAPSVFLSAFAVYGLGFLTASWRWYLLLDHIKVRLPFLTVMRLALIGLFFNLFVPGGVGGDLIKMVYLKKESGDRYPQALLTVFLDRLLGLAGLLLLAVLAMAMNRSMIASSTPEMKGIIAVVGLASAGGLAFGLVFLAWPLLARWGSGPSASLRRRMPDAVVSVGAKVAEALDLLRAAPLKLFGLLLLSTIGHLTAALGVHLLARGMGAGSELTFAECLLATQLANLVAAVPLTPGGLGGRDLVMSLLMRQAGASATLAGSVPILITVLLITWSLLGGLALLWERGTGLAAGISQESPKSRE